MHSHNLSDDAKTKPSILDSFDAITKVMSNNAGSVIPIDTILDSKIVTQQMTWHNSRPLRPGFIVAGSKGALSKMYAMYAKLIKSSYFPCIYQIPADQSVDLLCGLVQVPVLSYQL